MGDEGWGLRFEELAPLGATDNRQVVEPQAEPL